METKELVIECKVDYPHTKREKLFRAILLVFNYESSTTDKTLLDSLIQKGLELANKVNPGGANNASKKREFEKIKNNCVAGIISEYCWKEHLNDNGAVKRVEETPFSSASNQIDLKIIKNNQTIEVRSSFPRNGIPFAICHPEREFDIIGPYANDYKPSEIKKDFYIRTLFHLKEVRVWVNPKGEKIRIIEKILEKVYKNGFEVYLTGGADWAMMANDKIAENKHFIPQDEMSMDRVKTASEYRVVPFRNALDTKEVYEIIKGVSL